MGLGRIGDQKAAKDLLAVSNPPLIDPLPRKEPVPDGNEEEGDVQKSPIIEEKVHEFDDVTGWKSSILLWEMLETVMAVIMVHGLISFTQKGWIDYQINEWWKPPRLGKTE